MTYLFRTILNKQSCIIQLYDAFLSKKVALFIRIRSCARVIHSLRSWELPSVASISFAVICSLRSRHSFAALMGNAPAGRVSHSLRSWKCSRWSRQSFAALMGNAPLRSCQSASLRSWEMLPLVASVIRCAHGKCSRWSRQSFAALMGKCSRWSRQSFAALMGKCSRWSRQSFAALMGKCSRWSRQSFAALMGNAPAGRVSHSLRSWGNAPCGRVSHSLRSWGNAPAGRVIHSLRSWEDSRWSCQSFAALMGNAPVGRVSHSLRSWGMLPCGHVIQLRCKLLTLFASFIRCAHGKCFHGRVIRFRSCNCSGRVSHSLRSWNAPVGRVIQLRCKLLTLFVSFIRCAHGEYSLRSCQSASLLIAHFVRVSHSLRSWGMFPAVTSVIRYAHVIVLPSVVSVSYAGILNFVFHNFQDFNFLIGCFFFNLISSFNYIIDKIFIFQIRCIYFDI